MGGLTLPHKGSFKVAAAEPRTILLNVPWTPNASFESICTNVMARQTVGQTDYWICYGPAGESGEVTLKRKTPAAGPGQFDFTYPAGDAVSEIKLDSGDGHHAALLVMNTEMTNRTWLAHDKIYVGPSFVLEDGRMEFPPEGGKATIYAASGKSEMTQAAATVPGSSRAGKLVVARCRPGTRCKRRNCQVAYLERPAANGNLRQLPEPLRLVSGHAACGQGRPRIASLRWAIRDVRPVPERPARHDDHVELRPVRHPHLS